MPKYFNDVKQLPNRTIELKHDEVDADILGQKLAHSTDKVAVSVRLPGLPGNSLGYVFFIEADGKLFSICDITGVTHFANRTAEQLATILKHAAGIKYDPDVQEEFRRIRNEIGVE